MFSIKCFRVSPSTPPPSPRVTRSFSHDEILEENLVHISVLLVDKASPEYKEKYNETKRFVDVDFNCLDTKINQQTWVVLLDFLGLGAKVHDVDILAGKESDPKNKPVNPGKNSFMTLMITFNYIYHLCNRQLRKNYCLFIFRVNLELLFAIY